MGTISWNEFLNFAKQLMLVSERLCDGWNIVTINEERIGEVYLTKKELKVNSNARRSTDDDQLQNWEYHILYSPSYSVPVFYFNVSDSRGRSLGTDEIVAELNIKPDPSRNIKNVISQTEHPILRKPYYYLHPCHTKEFIAAGTRNKLITWLSCVANIVNLNLSLEYGVGVI